METLIPADPVKLVRSWMDDQFPWPVTVVKNRPNPVVGRTVTVRRNGGLRSLFIVDQAWLLVECFAADDEQTAELAAYVWGLLFAMENEIIEGVQCYRVQALGAPNDLPDTDAQLSRFVMSVQATFRTVPV